MKICSTCREDKPLSEFPKRSASTDGLGYICKPCVVVKSRAWRAANVERHRAYASAWQRNNKERANQRSREWRAGNKARRAATVKAWEGRNPDYLRSKLAERRSKLFTPAWADKGKIAALYREAVRLEKETGVAYHVDHIVPVNSRLVCGLHVEHNLRVIQAAANIAKSNRSWPDMA